MREATRPQAELINKVDKRIICGVIATLSC
jgi:hypothetical protein